MAGLRLVLVEDEDDDAAVVVETLRADGFRLGWRRADTGEKLVEVLHEFPPDLVISDYRIPGFGAAEALSIVQQTGLDVPFILISGHIGEDAAVAMMHAGAHDFVRKDHLYRLAPAVRRELREAESRRERRVALEALRRSEEDLRLLVEQVQDLIFRCCVYPRFELSFLSPAVQRLTGCAAAELLGDPSGFLSFVMDAEERAALEESWRTGTSTSLVVCFRRADGGMAWLEQRAHGRYADGRLVVVEGMLRDVTERVLTQREHELLVQQLQQAERLESLGLLAGGVAHDFNNALAVILNSAVFLTEDLPAGSPSRTDLDRIVGAAQRSAALAGQLLVFARHEPESNAVADINAMVASLREMLGRTIGEDVQLVCEPASSPAWVACDQAKMEQVLLNLVVNARAAMPQGGTMTIRTEAVDIVDDTETTASAKSLQLRPGSYVRISVTDTGVGMTPDVLRRAFDPFFTTKPAGQGTGLGLAMAYGAVQQAGGIIEMYSQPGQGTQVVIHLPLAPRGTGDEPDAFRRVEGGNGETILLVEDDTSVRDVVNSVLTRHSYRVVQAGSASDALTLLDELHGAADLVLTDVVMPGMGGVRLAARIRQTYPGVPILYMSGYTAERLTAQEIGEDIELIQKPFTQEHLLARLRKVLDAAKQQCA